MNNVKHRYSAEIQRTKGLLELAAALYDTSLSFQTTRAAEQAIQTESHVGYSLTLALTATREQGISFSFAADGFRELQAVSRGKLSVAWINPSVAATMAYRGKGLFSSRQPIRTIAVFPSYDVMAFAVHESTGITSLAQISKERLPLRVSTGTISKAWIKHSPTMFTVNSVTERGGLYLCEAAAMGREDSVGYAPEPPRPARRPRKGNHQCGLRRGHQKLGTDRDRRGVSLPTGGGKNSKEINCDRLSPDIFAQVAFSRPPGRRTDCGFQRLAHGGPRRYAGRGRVCSLRSH
jgi:hypothetical protein